MRVCAAAPQRTLQLGLTSTAQVAERANGCHQFKTLSTDGSLEENDF